PCFVSNVGLSAMATAAVTPAARKAVRTIKLRRMCVPSFAGTRKCQSHGISGLAVVASHVRRICAATPTTLQSRELLHKGLSPTAIYGFRRTEKSLGMLY